MKTPFLLLFCFIFMIGEAHADVQLDGVDDSLNQSSTMGNFVVANAFTMMTYIKSTGSDFAGTECYEGDFLVGDSLVEMMFIGRTGFAGETFCAYTQDTPGNFYAVFGSDTSLPAGWHHLALRLEAGTLTLFVDGISVGTRGSVADLSASPLTLATLQYGNAGGLPSSDRLTELKTYNVAVPDDEIRRLGGSRLRTYGRTTPTGYWTLEDCPEGTAGLGPFRDLTGNNRTLIGSNGGSGLTCVGAEFVSRPWGIQ